MLLALADDENGNLNYGPDEFSESEISVAENNGVMLKLLSSKTAKGTYLANICKECDSFVGL
jgi:hypothetical protein